MTALGADAPNVVGLVYIAAFGLDEGESLGALLSQGPVAPALAHMFTDARGFGWLSEDDFVNHFAADVDPAQARVFYAVQQPLAVSAFGDVMGFPAWKSLPTWYLVAQNDEALPPDAERQFAARMGATTVEIPSSHVPMVSHPNEVADLIEKAADAVGVPAATRLNQQPHSNREERTAKMNQSGTPIPAAAVPMKALQLSSLRLTHRRRRAHRDRTGRSWPRPARGRDRSGTDQPFRSDADQRHLGVRPELPAALGAEGMVASSPLATESTHLV